MTDWLTYFVVLAQYAIGVIIIALFVFVVLEVFAYLWASWRR